MKTINIKTNIHYDEQLQIVGYSCIGKVGKANMSKNGSNSNIKSIKDAYQLSINNALEFSKTLLKYETAKSYQIVIHTRYEKFNELLVNEDNVSIQPLTKISAKDNHSLNKLSLSSLNNRKYELGLFSAKYKNDKHKRHRTVNDTKYKIVRQKQS